jgi:hypothetical protein
MVHLSKPNINADGNILTSAGFTLHETIYFWSLVFITDHFASMSLSPKGSDSDVIFVGMLHNGSPSLLTILEDSSNEGDTASSRGKSSSSPDPQGCNVVTPTIPIGGHFGAFDHPDGPVADHCATIRPCAPS